MASRRPIFYIFIFRSNCAGVRRRDVLPFDNAAGARATQADFTSRCVGVHTVAPSPTPHTRNITSPASHFPSIMLIVLRHRPLFKVEKRSASTPQPNPSSPPCPFPLPSLLHCRIKTQPSPPLPSFPSPTLSFPLPSLPSLRSSPLKYS